MSYDYYRRYRYYNHRRHDYYRPPNSTWHSQKYHSVSPAFESHAAVNSAASAHLPATCRSMRWHCSRSVLWRGCRVDRRRGGARLRLISGLGGDRSVPSGREARRPLRWLWCCLMRGRGDDCCHWLPRRWTRWRRLPSF